MLSRVAILSKFKTSQFKCTSCCLHFWISQHIQFYNFNMQ
jgi:hypothetical protein